MRVCIGFTCSAADGAPLSWIDLISDRNASRYPCTPCRARMSAFYPNLLTSAPRSHLLVCVCMYVCMCVCLCVCVPPAPSGGVCAAPIPHLGGGGTSGPHCSRMHITATRQSLLLLSRTNPRTFCERVVCPAGPSAPARTAPPLPRKLRGALAFWFCDCMSTFLICVRLCVCVCVCVLVCIYVVYLCRCVRLCSASTRTVGERLQVRVRLAAGYHPYTGRHDRCWHGAQRDVRMVRVTLVIAPQQHEGFAQVDILGALPMSAVFGDVLALQESLSFSVGLEQYKLDYVRDQSSSLCFATPTKIFS